MELMNIMIFILQRKFFFNIFSLIRFSTYWTKFDDHEVNDINQTPYRSQIYYGNQIYFGSQIYYGNQISYGNQILYGKLGKSYNLFYEKYKQ